MPIAEITEDECVRQTFCKNNLQNSRYQTFHTFLATSLSQSHTRFLAIRGRLPGMFPNIDGDKTAGSRYQQFALYGIWLVLAVKQSLRTTKSQVTVAWYYI